MHIEHLCFNTDVPLFGSLSRTRFIVNTCPEKMFCRSLACKEEHIQYLMFTYFWMYFAKVLLKILIIFTSFLPHSKFFIRIGTLNKTNYSMDLFNTNWTSFILNSFRFTYQSNCQPCKWTIRIWSIWFKRIALDLTQMMPRECKNELC